MTLNVYRNWKSTARKMPVNITPRINEKSSLKLGVLSIRLGKQFSKVLAKCYHFYWQIKLKSFHLLKQLKQISFVFATCSSASVVNFEDVNAGWEKVIFTGALETSQTSKAELFANNSEQRNFFFPKKAKSSMFDWVLNTLLILFYLKLKKITFLTNYTSTLEKRVSNNSCYRRYWDLIIFYIFSIFSITHYQVLVSLL